MGFLDQLKRSFSQVFSSGQEEEAQDSTLITDSDQQQRYILQKALGTGAMGEVWLATDTLLNRAVAIKYLKVTQDERYKGLFLSEAQVLARLNHPNITLIYDAVFDDESSRFYLVMEYVKGKTLAQLIQEQEDPLPLDTVLDVSIDILQALEYAHNQGVVHRDIKPANVILQEERAKLTDFGVAGLMSLLATNEDQVIVGTPSYMSPEQIAGQNIDGRADLYSLGIMIFEMCSGGRRPFEGNSPTAVFEAHQETPPPPLGQFAPDAPLALEHMVMKLLAKEPAERYPSAKEALATLQSIRARQKFKQPHLNLLEVEAHPLVNRQPEMEQLKTTWNEIQQSARPSLVIVQGEMGIGKSRLVTEFLGREVIDRGLVALVGRSGEADTPYAPFATILATIINKKLTTLSKEQVYRLIDHMPDLARLLNISGGGSGEKNEEAIFDSGLWQSLRERTAPEVTSTAARQEFFPTVLAVLARLEPTVIFLESATFLDEASVTLTEYLTRQEQLPLLFITACRQMEGTRLWTDSFPADQKAVITLAPLATPAIEQYIANMLGGPVSEAVVHSAAQSSRGNPFRLEEVVEQMLENQEIKTDESGQWHYVAKELAAPSDAFLPKSVLGAFTRRIMKLSEQGREGLALAAMLEPGPEFSLELWAALLDEEGCQATTQQILAEALDKRLLRKVDEERYTFRPEDVAKALKASLPASRRLDLHRQIANILHHHQADSALLRYHIEQVEAAS